MVNFRHGCKSSEKNVVGILWSCIVQEGTPKSAEAGSKVCEDVEEVSADRRARCSELAAGRKSLVILI